MLLKELFSHISADKISKTINKYHIEVPGNYQFSKINIVIGPNGSGKTRFLKAIRELYKADKSRDVLYGYFPALSDRKIPGNKHDDDLPEYTLYEAMYGENVTFADFFKEIEQHNEEFIPDLLTYSSRTKKERGEKAIKIIRDSFLTLTGKELLNQEKLFFVKANDGRKEPLSKALATLSPGELMLFYMSVFLAIQQNGKKDKVIILDEPESHLHPKALLSFIELLTQTTEFKEIWIATHSLFIIPAFQFENITYICNSSVQGRKSTIYQNIYSEILGDEEGKVRTFFSSLSQWQYCEFIAECFTDPTVIDTVNPKDEQVQLFIECLKKQRPYRILDCGGGSGRLGLSLKEALQGNMKGICYTIYDSKPAYKGSDFAVYTKLEEIKEPYDCVVMMNFLHEVDPEKWRSLFHEIYNQMTDNAYLVFVEVAALRQGEMPNESGYFVLGKKELEILFGDTRELVEIRHRENQKSMCMLVPRERLLQVSDDSVRTAIKCLEERMLKELRTLKKKESAKKANDTNVKNARHFAFLTQQYIHAKLFLETSEEEESKNELLPKMQLEGIAERCKGLLYVQSYIDMGALHADLETMQKINIMLDDAIIALQKDGKVSRQTLAEFLKYAMAVEIGGGKKEVIALFLAALSLMGDSKSYSKLKNEEYIRYLPLELRDYVFK